MRIFRVGSLTHHHFLSVLAQRALSSARSKFHVTNRPAARGSCKALARVAALAQTVWTAAPPVTQKVAVVSLLTHITNRGTMHSPFTDASSSSYLDLKHTTLTSRDKQDRSCSEHQLDLNIVQNRNGRRSSYTTASLCSCYSYHLSLNSTGEDVHLSAPTGQHS